MAKPDKIRENTDKLLNFVSDKFMAGELDNQSMVEFIKLSGSFLNLMTIADYARTNKMSYEGAKRFRHTEEIFGVRFVVDNL